MLSIEVNLPIPDIKQTEELYHKELTKATIDALATWVIDTTDVIPVWSGAARASFLKLATEAKVQVDIAPVAPSRIPLGIAESTGVVIAEPLTQYGWDWSSTLDHIGIVDDRVGFVDVGLNSIKDFAPELPQPIFN